MTPQEQRSLLQQAARADHELLSFGIENFKRLFMGRRPVDAGKQFGDIQQIMAKKLEAHFTHEENLLFPALLASNPSAETIHVIDELLQEHMALLERARLLNALLRGRTPTNCTGELWSAMLNFFADLEKHAAKEDKLFKSFS